jgi:AraC-like DNA-binding protein
MPFQAPVKLVQAVRPLKAGGWQRAAVESIDDLRNAVLDAGLEAMQLSRTPITGSLLFLAGDEIVLSSGLLESRVGLRGPLSDRGLTIGFGLRLGEGSRHWLRDVETGGVGIFRGGDEHDALYGPRSLYLAMTLSEERLITEGERLGLIIEEQALRSSGIHPRSQAEPVLQVLRQLFLTLHARGGAAEPAVILDAVISAAVEHLGRTPVASAGLSPIRGHERIVARARDYVAAHLHQPISVDTIANATSTSRRTLSRAFADVLGCSPQSYVLRLRLHRIRRDLASEEEAAHSVAIIANRWGVGELGRLAGRYRVAFGESPSETRLRTLATVA